MKKMIGLFSVLLLLFLVGMSQASILYDENVSPGIIFGSGNANGYFAVDRLSNQMYDLEVGLRAKLAYQGVYNSNESGTYTFNTGVHPNFGAPAAAWNFEFSVNTDVSGAMPNNYLQELAVLLSIDTDPGVSQSWVSFNPFAVFQDNALGYYNTANGAGYDSASANGNWGIYTVGQNSMNLGWVIQGFDPNLAGIYDFKLAVGEDAPGGFNPFVETAMRVVVVSADTPAVPEPATLLLFGMGILTLTGLSRRKK